MKNKKRLILLICILLGVVSLALASSYALFTFNVTKHTNFKIAIGTLELSINDTTTEDKFIMKSTVPTKDEVALTQDGYTFTLSNTGNIDSYYTVYLDDILLSDAGERLGNSYIKLNLLNQKTNQSNTNRLSGYPETNRVLTTGFLKSGENITYTLRMWVDYNAGNEAQNKYFATQIRVVGTQANVLGYQEDLLNGATPVLTDNLVPVQIAADGTVTKANIQDEWYSYEKKNWANAVVLKTQKTYKNGETIPDNNIKQYYVWIPRYRYQLWNVDSNVSEGAEQAINIVFENKDTKVSNGTKNGEWLTHPAFTSFNTNGLWVGKFETSYDEASFTNSSVFASRNPNTSAVTTGSNILIKPNLRSLTNKNVSTFYTLGREVNSSLNSHMMKNSEWGATAYLTYSNYGKCTSDGCEEVYINNVNTGYYPASSATYSGQWQYGASITGCGASSVSADAVGNMSSCTENYAWNGSNNKASTTGNISGIYDMSGGNFEYVMGVIKDASGNPMSGRNDLYNSGFNGTYGCPTCESQSILSKTNEIEFPTDTRYYNLYEANSTTLGDDTWYQYTNGQLGDVSREVAISKANASNGVSGLWFDDYAVFPTATYPWVYRGGNFSNGSGAGVFGFGRAGGNAGSGNGFRVVLAPTK